MSTTTNRLGVPTGLSGRMDYDAAGYLTNDSYTAYGSLDGTPTRAYDAEGRMTQAQFLSGQVQTAVYTYDADGRRVKRDVGASAEVWQVYGMEGELLAEYTPTAAPSSLTKEYGYRGGELLVTAEAGTAPRVNAALASQGATAAASSSLDANRPASAAINGDRKGAHWGSDPATGSGWHCATNNAYPDWLEVSFSSARTIDEISVFTLQDNYTSPAEPSEAMTFTQYGVTAFQLEYWTGTAWAAIPNTSVTGNNKVWRRFVLQAPVTTQKIRVSVSAALAGYSRITEVEAWGAPVNVAAAAAGATASASSTLDAGRTAQAAINGDRKGLHWGSDPSTGSGWHDATNNSYPDWLQVDFAATKTIGEVSVFSVQDNVSSPSEPTESMTFSQYGVSSFHLEYWTGSAWATVQGSSVSGNNKVWRRVTFAPVATSKLRVVVTSGLAGYSRIVEVEAWEAATGGAEVRWLVTDHLGTPRMVLDKTGSLAGVSRHDYFPFGEEIQAGVGGRTTIQGHSQLDEVRMKFTGAERDDETGLDFMQARYFSSTQGRFTSPDPLLSSGELHDPQTWNRYAYALNNPLLYTDPTGLFVYGKNVTDEQKKQFEAALNKAKSYLNKLAETYGKNSNEYKKAERALNSYGKPGEANGVTVIGNDKVDAGKTILNDKAITVAFNPNQFENTFFQALVGHEGSHVADAKDYLSTGKSPTEYQFEYDGHFVQSVLGETQAKEMNYVNFYVNVGGSKNAPEQKVELWNKSWEEADKATLRDKAVSQALAVSQKDTGYPSNTQKTFRTTQPGRRKR